MRSAIIGLTLAAAVGLFAIPASAKTVKDCNAEYAANKNAIKGAGQKKADFVSACRAGTETIPDAAAAPAPAPTTTAAPAPAPAPATPAGNATKKKAVTPNATVPTGANEFTAEAQATAHCPGQTVVWANA